MACPGASCREYAIIPIICEELCALNSDFISQVWAREYCKGKFPFAQYSIIPIAEQSGAKRKL